MLTKVDSKRMFCVGKSVALLMLAFLCVFSLFFPLIGLYVLVYFVILFELKADRGLLRGLVYFLSLHAAFSFSVLLSKRRYEAGYEIGYGDDMVHYAAAFDFVGSWGWDNFSEMLSGVVWLTGGGEPFFWLIVKVLTLFFSDAAHIHVALSMLGFSLIFFAAEMYNKTGSFVLALYFSTITVYAFQGSAVRSGIALGLMAISIALFLKGKMLSARLWGAGAFLSHFSMAPFAMVFLRAPVVQISYGVVVRIFVVSILLVSFMYVAATFTSLGILQQKIDARLSEVSSDSTSVIQFLVESAVVSALVFWQRRKLNPKLIYIFILYLAVDIVFLAIFPTMFSRIYRYVYIVYLVFFSELAVSLGRRAGCGILMLALFWHGYIVSSRYQGLFANEGVLGHFMVSWFDFLKL